MRSSLTFAFSLASVSLLSAHPGHGIVEHETQPIIHHFTSQGHLGSIALAFAAMLVTVIAYRLLTDGSCGASSEAKEAGQSGCN